MIAIPSTGADGAYFAKLKCDDGEYLYGCASCKYGRVVLTTTSEEEYGPFEFHLKPKGPNPYEADKLIDLSGSEKRRDGIDAF